MSTQTESKNGAIAPANSAAPVTEEGKTLVARVQNLVANFVEKGQINLPEDYSPGNALRSAWLVISQDSNLKSATQESIANALLSYVIQGLNVDKRQCYFIKYGNQLTMQRSYFGDAALAQRVMPGIKLWWGVVHEGEEFRFETIRGRKIVIKHEQTIESLERPIVAAYCEVEGPDGVPMGAEIMTFDRIKQSWTMSKTYKPDGNSPHNKFPEEMALRTVIRKRCIQIINTSNDAVLMQHIRDQEVIETEESMEAEARTFGNGDYIDVGGQDVSDQVEPAQVIHEPTKQVASSPAPAEEPGY